VARKKNNRRGLEEESYSLHGSKRGRKVTLEEKGKEEEKEEEEKRFI
jgi:hypothetical protein